MNIKNNSTAIVILICFALLCMAIVLAFSLGQINVPLAKLWPALVGDEGSTSIHTTAIRHLRLPRIVLACFAGAGLATAGLVFQCVLRNPLAEPYILGVSGGAAVGHTLALIMGFGFFATAAGALLGAMAVILVVLGTSLKQKTGESLLLCGVMVNAFCGAIILFLIALAKSSEVSRIMFWFMGNLASINLHGALVIPLVFTPLLAILMLNAHSMNLLALGDTAAHSLGLNVTKHMYLLLFTASIMVTAVVVAAGPIGFIGLLIPQTLRLFLGADHRKLIPACMLAGASFLVFCDLLARTLPASGELPVGVVTALFGAPLFIYLQRKIRWLS